MLNLRLQSKISWLLFIIWLLIVISEVRNVLDGVEPVGESMIEVSMMTFIMWGLIISAEEWHKRRNQKAKS